MNRPLWLDLVCMVGVMSPPILGAALLARWLGVQGIIGVAAFIGLAFTAIVAWFAAIVVWSRITGRPP